MPAPRIDTSRGNGRPVGSDPEARTGARARPPHRGRPGKLALAAVALVLVLSGLRAFHLEADTPAGLSWSFGLYVDEGYKTLAPRNVVLFGSANASESDRYRTWWERSPLTQWAYLAAFRIWEPNLRAARAVSVIFFAVFLLAYAWGLAERYPPGLLLGGMLLLGLESGLFLVSRIALLEVPLLALFYGGLFALARWNRPSAWAPVSLLGGGVLLAVAVKKSALLYLLPASLAALVPVLGIRRPSRRIVVGTILVAGGSAAVALFGFGGRWMPRLDLLPSEILRRLLTYPLLSVSPVTVVAGWLAAVHLLVVRPRAVLEDTVRSILVALVLLGPILLSLLEYNPLRYAAPFLPAYLLLVLEWVRLRSWAQRIPFDVSPVVHAVSVPLLALAVVYAGRSVDDLVLSHLPLPLGEEPGLSTSAETLVFGSLALPVAVLLWRARSRWLEGPGLARVARVLGAALVLHSAAILAGFFLEPRFEGREGRRALEEVLPDSASLAGDWAPFFALGTRYRAFYLGAHGHPPERIEEICPDYLLHSETDTGKRSLRILTANPRVLVGDAIFTKRYAERKVSLHPLHYAAGPCARAPRPVPGAGSPSPSGSPGG